MCPLQGMAHLEPLMTSPDLCPANSLSSFLLAAAKNKLNFKDVHKVSVLLSGEGVQMRTAGFLWP